MNFQNPSFKFFLNGRTNGRTDKRTDGRTSRKQYAPHFFKVGGIITNSEDTEQRSDLGLPCLPLTRLSELNRIITGLFT